MTEQQRIDIVIYRIENAISTLDEIIVNSLYPETRRFVYRIKELIDVWLEERIS